MPTNTRATSARRVHTQQVHELRKSFTFAAGNGAVLNLGVVPAGAIITGGGVHVDVVFNAGTANTADVGFEAHGAVAADADALATALALGSVGYKVLDELAAATNRKLQADTVINATLVLSGTAATTGTGTFVIQYSVNNGE